MKALYIYIMIFLLGLSIGHASLLWFDSQHSKYVVEGDYSSFIKEYDSETVLVSLSVCEYCFATKTILNEQQVSYKELVLDRDKLAYKKFKQHIDLKAVPILIKSDRLHQGYNEKSILKFL